MHQSKAKIDKETINVLNYRNAFSCIVVSKCHRSITIMPFKFKKVWAAD